MQTTRRRAICWAVLGAGAAADAADADVNLAVLRSVSSWNGAALGDDRLRIVEPVIKQRRPQLERLRAFEIDDAVGPTQGIGER